jgi:hypothetical protein
MRFLSQPGRNGIMKIAIHIGYPKAASTTLQKHLFHKHSELNNLGNYPTANVGTDSKEIDFEAPFLKSKELKQFYSNILQLDDIEYAFSKNDVIFDTYVLPQMSEDKINIFSHEGFLATFFSNPDRGGKAKRLCSYFKEPKILIIIRNQFELVRSQYADWPFDPRAFTLRRKVEIDEWIQIDMNAPESKHFIRSLNFYYVANYYAALFGKENVRVFLFEEMTNNLDRFAHNISGFLGIDADQTRAILSDKHENKARDNQLRSQKIDPGIINRLNGYFAQINRSLIEAYPLNLAAYDYPL